MRDDQKIRPGQVWWNPTWQRFAVVCGRNIGDGWRVLMFNGWKAIHDGFLYRRWKRVPSGYLLFKDPNK